MSKGYTFYSKQTGMEISTTSAVKEKEGAEMKEGRVRLRFFNIAGGDPMYFMMKPEEAFALAVKATETVGKGCKYAFTHKFAGKEGEMVTKLAVDCFQSGKEGQKTTRYALILSRGEDRQVNVPMSAEGLLYLAELARAFSVEQAWTSYKKPGTDDETPERGEQDTETPGAEIEEVEEPVGETAAQAQETAAPAQAETARFRAVSVKGLTKTGKAIVEIDGKDVFETRYTKRAEGVSLAVGAQVEVALENGYITDIRAAA